MNDLLVFYALPIATIILSVVLERVLKSPLLVGSTAFAIYLIVTFAAFDINFLLFAIIYSILAYIGAVLARIFFRAVVETSNNVLVVGNNDNNNLTTVNSALYYNSLRGVNNSNIGTRGQANKRGLTNRRNRKC